MATTKNDRRLYEFMLALARGLPQAVATIAVAAWKYWHDNFPS